MGRDGRAMSKVDSWSYSWVEKAKCWLKVYWLKYAPKEIKVKVDFSGPAAEEGTRLHKNIEDVLRGVGSLDPDLHKIKSIVAMHKDEAKGQSYPEYEINVDKNWMPVAGDDWNNCWLRVRIDALKINASGTKVLVDDWKTGKNQKVDELQLQLYAVALFKLREMYERFDVEQYDVFKNIEVVNARFVWTRTGDKDLRTFKYEDRDALWQPFKEFLAAREKNKKYNSWPASPGFACQWCDAREICPHGD
jgi:flagellar biosynthesis regulator FlaF